MSGKFLPFIATTGLRQIGTAGEGDMAWWKPLLHWLGQSDRVEFDYQDGLGVHHGRCYVSHMFTDRTQVIRMLSSYGYRNIHICDR